ncbi:MAG: ComE operon protein 1 [bacterium ADurb.BinA186]|nr:MAG: ComE operon protein 1 [bacterium ADurb.BinA186]
MSWKKKPKLTFKGWIRRKLNSVKEVWGKFLVAIHLRKKPDEPKKKNILPDLPDEKLDVGAFIEKYRFAIGAALLFLILLSGGFLLYRENYFKPSLEKKIEDQEAKIAFLESRIAALENQKSGVAASVAPVATTQVADQTGTVSGVSTTSSTKPVGKVNINTASASELDTLPGIGTAYAGRIIDYRNSHGGFKSIEELKNVKGIGDKTFEKLADLVTI